MSLAQPMPLRQNDQMTRRPLWKPTAIALFVLTSSVRPLDVLLTLVAFAARANAAGVKPGDLITKDNAAQVQDLLSPGNFILVQRGMQIHVIATDKLDWPPPYKTASEKYASQVTSAPMARSKASSPDSRSRCSIRMTPRSRSR